MKALVLTAKRELKIQDVPLPVISHDEVLLRVKACGICGSDVHGYFGSYGRRIPPIIMGHEASGEIVSLGENVSEWKLGDRVTFNSTINCGVCFYCRRGLTNLCDQRKIFGVSCAEYRQAGAFAEFVAVPQRILYLLPGEMRFEEGAMSEPLAVAVHGVNLSQIKLDESVVVIGSGVIGLLAIQTLRLLTAGQIIALDIEDQRLESAKALGADFIINSSDPEKLEKELASTLPGDGVDVVIDAVGLPQTVTTGVRSLRKGGTLIHLGNYAERVEIPLQEVVGRQLRLQGSCAASHEYETALTLIHNKQVNVSRLLSQTAPLEVGAEWFERLAAGKNPALFKVMLIP